jgi:hypothetical protein
MLKSLYYLPIIAISPVLANSFSVAAESNNSPKLTVEYENGRVHHDEITLQLNRNIGAETNISLKDFVLYFMENGNNI